MSGKIITTCFGCGKEIYIFPSEKRRKNYCTLDCYRNKRRTEALNGIPRVAASGRFQIFLPDHPRAIKGCVPEHILIAERALGKPIPIESEVHHIDGNPQNNKNNNLVICEDHSYHLKLEVRTRVLMAGGNPNTDKICSRCKKAKNKSEFYPVNDKDGYFSYCKKCDAQRYKEKQPKWKEKNNGNGS